MRNAPDKSRSTRFFAPFRLEKSAEIEKVNQNEGEKPIRLKARQQTLEHKRTWRRFAVAKLAGLTIVIIFSRRSCKLGWIVDFSTNITVTLIARSLDITDQSNEFV